MRKSLDFLAGETLDLTNAIELITPTDTPMSTIVASKGKKTKAMAVNVTWREEALDANNIDGALEGADAPAVVETTRTLADNNCMIMTKTASVSGTAKELGTKGVSDELQREIQNRLTEIKRDAEIKMLNGTKTDETEGVTARECDGLINLVSNTVVATTLTEQKIVDAFKTLYDAGQGQGASNVIFVPADVYTLIKALLEAKTTSYLEEGANKTLGINVARFVCEYGSADIVLNRHMPAQTALLVDMDKVEIAELRTPRAEMLGKVGDSYASQVIYEMTVKLLNTFAGCSLTGIAG